MKRFKRMISLVSIAALSIGLLAGCGDSKDDGGSTSSDNGDVVKLGIIAPQTGQVAVYGKATLNGAQLAIEEYNEAGGILDGKKIEAVVYDDKGDNAEAINAYKKLTSSDNVAGIIGPVISTNTLAIAPLADKDGLPMITPTGTAEDITIGKDAVFRSCFTDSQQGQIIAKYSLEKLNGKKAAILNEQTDYGQGLAKTFKEYYEKNGGEIVEEKAYSSGDKDFKSALTDIKSADPDVVFLAGYYNEIALIGKQAKETGLDADLVGGDGWDGVLEIDPESIEGGFFSNHYSPDDKDEIVQNFVKKYQDKYNGEEPKSFSALGYDAAKTMLEAIDKAGSTDRKAIVDQIKKTDLPLVSGKTKFDENGDPIKEVSIIKVEKGNYKLEDKLELEK
ncbi:MAG: ABC transporter substrate-binding protein [Andreesenia angusta]|nr:ABC transporter substrate-binding protein [Andreesenia angusta]